MSNTTPIIEAIGRNTDMPSHFYKNGKKPQTIIVDGIEVICNSTNGQNFTRLNLKELERSATKVLSKDKQREGMLKRLEERKAKKLLSNN